MSFESKTPEQIISEVNQVLSEMDDAILCTLPFSNKDCTAMIEKFGRDACVRLARNYEHGRMIGEVLAISIKSKDISMGDEMFLVSTKQVLWIPSRSMLPKISFKSELQLDIPIIPYYFPIVGI